MHIIFLIFLIFTLAFSIYTESPIVDQVFRGRESILILFDKKKHYQAVERSQLSLFGGRH